MNTFNYVTSNYRTISLDMRGGYVHAGFRKVFILMHHYCLMMQSVNVKSMSFVI